MSIIMEDVVFEDINIDELDEETKERMAAFLNDEE